MRNDNAFLAVILFVCILGFALGYWSAQVRYNPSCPTEDSCYPSYENGRWQIIEGERPSNYRVILPENLWGESTLPTRAPQPSQNVVFVEQEVK